MMVNSEMMRFTWLQRSPYICAPVQLGRSLGRRLIGWPAKLLSRGADLAPANSQ